MIVTRLNAVPERNRLKRLMLFWIAVIIVQTWCLIEGRNQLKSHRTGTTNPLLMKSATVSFQLSVLP